MRFSPWSAAALTVAALCAPVLTAGSGAAAATSSRAEALVAEAGRDLEAGDLESAARRFREARELAPELPLPWLGLAEVGERRGEPVAALELARRARELGPELPAAALATGRLLARLGAVAPALAAFEDARELAPGQPQAYLVPALLLRDAGRSGEAIALLERGARHVRRPEVSEELGLLLLAEGRPAEALAAAEAALAAHPRRGPLHAVAGLALAADPERRGEAAPRLEQALELGVPEPGRLHLELGALHAEAGRREAALEHLREARRRLPDAPESHYRLGAALRAAGDADGARAALERFAELSRERDAAERRAREIGIALNEVQTLATAHRLPEALERLEALLEAHPREARALTLQAKVLFSMGRRQEALDSISRAREIDPGRVEPHFLEGLFLAHLERPAEAGAALRRALALDPDLDEARELLARLASGPGEGGR